MHKNTSSQSSKLSFTKQTTSLQKKSPQPQNTVQRKTNHQTNYIVKQTKNIVQINQINQIHQTSKTRVNCRACHGTGYFDQDIHKRCNGLGYVLLDRNQYRACKNCNHQGIVESKGWFFDSNVLCSVCHGLGLAKIKN